MVPLIRSILVTIPVRICSAKADKPMIFRAAVAAMISSCDFSEYSQHEGRGMSPGDSQKKIITGASRALPIILLPRKWGRLVVDTPRAGG